MKDLLIKNATVVSPADKISGRYDILIMNGKIAQIGENLSFDGETINAEGLYAIPGLVDMHVHLRDPVRRRKRIFLQAVVRRRQAELQACLQCRTQRLQPTAARL